MLNQLDGRDKIIKVIQYTAKLVISVSENSRQQEKLNSKLKSFAKVLSEARRVFRLGNWLDNLHYIFVGSFTSSPFIRILEKTSTISGFGCSFLEDLALIKKIWSGSSHLVDRLESWSDFFWTIQIFLDIILNFIQLNKIFQKERKLYLETRKDKERNEELVSLSQSKNKLQLSQIKLVADLIFAANDAFELEAPSILVAICGLLSALIGSYKIFMKLR